MKMSECFAGAGIEVELIIPTRKNILLDGQSPFDFYGIKKVFSIARLKTFDPTFLLRAPRGWFIKCQSLCFMISLFWFLTKHKNKSDCIFYTRDEYLLPLLQLFSKNVVWESHALPVHIDSYKKYLKNCSSIVVLTNQIKKDLIDLGLNSDRIWISPDAVDLEIFDIDINKSEARDTLNLPQDKKILGYTGSFKTKGMDKGINDILEALKSLNNDILFVAVGGNGDDILYYSDRAELLGVKEKVLFLGPVKQDELAIYQKSFDVLLMPFPYNKHYAYYMSPLKMFEYMASGRPIITSDLPSVRDVLNENNSIFCKSDDPKDLSEKIFLALRDSQLTDRITKRALMDVKEYTWEKRARAILKFINK